MIGLSDPVQMMIAALLVPLLAAVLIPVFHKQPNVREAVTLVAAGLLAWLVWSLSLIHISEPTRPY